LEILLYGFIKIFKSRKVAFGAFALHPRMGLQHSKEMAEESLWCRGESLTVRWEAELFCAAKVKRMETKDGGKDSSEERTNAATGGGKLDVEEKAWGKERSEEVVNIWSFQIAIVKDASQETGIDGRWTEGFVAAFIQQDADEGECRKTVKRPLLVCNRKNE
jgi:hypothetical protein